MKKFTTILTGAALTLMVSATSYAQGAENGADEIAFTYSPSAPAAVTYDRLKQQARKACDAELGPLKFYGEAGCVSDYVSEIVGKIDRMELTAYHNHEMTNAPKIIQMANLDKTKSRLK